MKSWRLSEILEELSGIQWSPRAGTETQGQVERTLEVWDRGNSLGLWECGEGKFPSQRVERTDVCLILSGRAIVVDDRSALSVEVHAGMILVLESGWRGSWEITEAIQKMYLNLPESETMG